MNFHPTPSLNYVPESPKPEMCGTNFAPYFSTKSDLLNFVCRNKRNNAVIELLLFGCEERFFSSSSNSGEEAIF